MSDTTIILNGKKYDAVTGKLLGPAHLSNASKDTLKPVEKSLPIETAESSQKTIKSPVVTKSINHASGRTMKSATLMRHQLKKPSTATNDIQHSISVSTHRRVNQDRETLLTRSAKVNKFNDFKSSTTKPQKPVTNITSSIPSAPPPISQSSTHTRTPSLKQNIFLSAIENADSHNQPKISHKSRSNRSQKASRNKKLVNLTSFAVSLLILGGFFAYQNVPNMSLKLASKNSGIVAKAPGYIPSGFSMDRSVAYVPGQVTLTFKSNTDDRSFQLTQKASSWNSEDLKSNFLASNFDNVQQLESNGNTIYLYDDNNATWVDGGVWYNLESSADLSSSQLLSFTKSI